MEDPTKPHQPVVRHFCGLCDRPVVKVDGRWWHKVEHNALQPSR